MNICHICNKEIYGTKYKQCRCRGARCNVCEQIYLGLAMDCLCTGITLDEYHAIGKEHSEL